MNLKSFQSFMKHALLALVMLTTIGITGCDDDDGPKIFAGTVAELMVDAKFQQAEGASADVALDSLVKYLTLNPALVTALSSSTEVTLFAPSNQAFINLLATPGFPANIELIDPEIVAGVLAYHIVPDQTVLKADLVSGATFETSYPAATSTDLINVNADGTLKTGSTNQNIEITSADNRAENGVIHVVESVMIPQSVGAAITPILGTMAGTVLLGADFSNLADLVYKADNGFTETSTSYKITTMLANPSANATFFATPNAVFAAAAGGSANVSAFINGLSQTQARGILLNSYVPGKYVVTATSGATTFGPSGQTLTAASGKTLTISISNPSTSNPYGVALTFTPTGGTTTSVAPIVSKDLIHSNGVIQVIAGIIL